ncbi:hypothetical protein PAEPH01_1092 [Pancytospora epiphaga]|nr:hypothetical protein PAEPH01_1092 [Pancytospora epiphaga]
MSVFLGLLLDSQPVKKRIVYVAKHKAVRGANFLYAFLSAVASAYGLLTCPREESDWISVFMSFYLFSMIYKLVVSYTGLVPVPVPTIIQIAVAEYEREITMIYIYTFLLDVFSLVLFVPLLQTKIKRDHDPLYKYSEVLLMTLTSIYLIEIATIFTIKLIASIANLSYKETKYSEKESTLEYGRVDPSDCPICKGDFTDDEMVKRLKCKHLFHSQCIDEWLDIKKSCPLCKQDGLDGTSIRTILER